METVFWKWFPFWDDPPNSDSAAYDIDNLRFMHNHFLAADKRSLLDMWKNVCALHDICSLCVDVGICSLWHALPQFMKFTARQILENCCTWLFPFLSTGKSTQYWLVQISGSPVMRADAYHAWIMLRSLGDCLGWLHAHTVPAHMFMYVSWVCLVTHPTVSVPMAGISACFCCRGNDIVQSMGQNATKANDFYDPFHPCPNVEGSQASNDSGYLFICVNDHLLCYNIHKVVSTHSSESHTHPKPLTGANHLGRMSVQMPCCASETIRNLRCMSVI